MVIFALNWKLTADLPTFLRHNEINDLHVGDFVLPMFLFASGLSLAISHQRARVCLLRKVSFWKRIALQVAISLVMAPFIGYSFLVMDELMLNALLSVPCALLLSMGGRALFVASSLTFILYSVLSSFDLLPLSNYYLGGYGAAIFYLPIMVAGATTFMDEGKVRRNLVGWGLLFVVTALFIPPRKLLVTPSFFALANMVCLLIYLGVRHRQHPAIEYLGRRPLRIWILLGGMVAGINMYENRSRTMEFLCSMLHLPKPHTLNIHWMIGIVFITGALFVFHYISHLIDGIKARSSSRLITS